MKGFRLHVRLTNHEDSQNDYYGSRGHRRCANKTLPPLDCCCSPRVRLCLHIRSTVPFVFCQVCLKAFGVHSITCAIVLACCLLRSPPPYIPCDPIPAPLTTLVFLCRCISSSIPPMRRWPQGSAWPHCLPSCSPPPRTWSPSAPCPGWRSSLWPCSSRWVLHVGMWNGPFDQACLVR